MKLHEFEAKLAGVSDGKLRRLLEKAEKSGPAVAVRFILAEAGRRGLWDLVDPEDHTRPRAVPKEERPEAPEPGEGPTEGTLGELAEYNGAVAGHFPVSVGTEKVEEEPAAATGNAADEQMPAVESAIGDDPEFHADITQEFRPVFADEEARRLAEAAGEAARREQAAARGPAGIREDKPGIGGEPKPSDGEARKAAGPSASRTRDADHSLHVSGASARWLAEEASREPFFLVKALVFLLTLGGLLRFLFKLLRR